MSTSGRRASRGQSEAEFYSRYAWCLNPILSVPQLLERLSEELDWCGRSEIAWQREECKINLYLLTCALTCAVDDYLARREVNLAGLSDRFPRWRFAVALGQALVDTAHSLRSVFWDWRVLRWRKKWDAGVEQVCEFLIIEPNGFACSVDPLRATLESLLKESPPTRLTRQRMRLPEGFRCQDLTHLDVLTLVRHFLARQPDKKKHYLVIGPRTAGAYFAPLVKAYLRRLGYEASWMSIRPRAGPSEWEKRRLRHVRNPAVNVLLVDDHPNTGRTFRLILALLRKFGAHPERITILAPRHPAHTDWAAVIRHTGGVAIITLDPRELHKVSLLSPAEAESALREYYGRENWDDVSLHESDELNEINARLERHYKDGFHVRLKRVLEVRLRKNGQTDVVRRVFAKSVGWGWLGYHGYVSGTRLQGLVPRVIGLRDGILFTEWLHPASQATADGAMLKVLSSYVAKRVRRVGLGEDPCFETPNYRWTGWDDIISIFRGAYGQYAGYLKRPALRKHLRRYLSPCPTLVDGQMRPNEWIVTDEGTYKADFEHHNFGGAELDLVDPAHDLAGAIFEFRLSRAEEEQVLRAYAEESGDRTVSERILLYKLLHGVLAKKYASRAVLQSSSERTPEESSERCLWARDFLVYQMNEFCGGLVRRLGPTRWTNRLFFLDLDGVFDRELFGFPHTTISGLAALALLQAHEVSIVLNTGRSVGHVLNYCESYGLPGGLAEYGSVFVDKVQQRERPLVDAETVEQLAIARDAFKDVPGVFIDPGYRYSIRAFRYSGQETGLQTGEVGDFLTRWQLDRLTFIGGPADTHLVQKGTSKGRAMLEAIRDLGFEAEPVAAMGDSDHDLAMLEAARWSYAPANCSQGIKELARKGKCRITAEPYQRGLVGAALDVLAAFGSGGRRNLSLPAVHQKDPEALLPSLLRVAERTRFQEWLAVLNWRGL